MAAGSESDSDAWQAACKEAIITLDHARKWILPDEAWGEVAQGLAQIRQALADSDPVLLTQGVTRIQACSGVRTKVQLGKGAVGVSTPKPVKEQITQITPQLQAGKGK
jgi:hypothetical protein